ncbi:MAG TPA: HD domain-containing protein [Haliangiales bacterium]|nr:HD domain-containing protein [Haliangiales bacterium]
MTGVMLGERFDRAMALAMELHRRHWRKGTTIPYLAHLLGVASLVLEHGGGEDEAAAALLHDAVEDQGGAPTLARIRAELGDAIADIVRAVSDTDVVPKPPWRERKERYLAHLPQAAAPARLVSAADKLHNARAIVADLRVHGEGVWDRFAGGREGTLWYYRSLVEAFQSGGSPGGPPAELVAELARTVGEMERLARED